MGWLLVCLIVLMCFVIRYCRFALVYLMFALLFALWFGVCNVLALSLLIVVSWVLLFDLTG